MSDATNKQNQPDDYLLGAKLEEIERVRSQGKIMWPNLEALLRSLNINPSSVFDLGTNEGDLLERVGALFPDSLRIGIDINQTAIDLAKSKKGDNQYYSGDFNQGIDLTQFGLEGVDLIMAHLVLMYIPLDDQKRQEFFARLYNMVNPGGIVVAVVPNMDNIGAIDLYQQVGMKLVINIATQYTSMGISPQLAGYFVQAGFEVTQNTVYYEITGEEGLKFLKIQLASLPPAAASLNKILPPEMQIDPDKIIPEIIEKAERGELGPIPYVLMVARKPEVRGNNEPTPEA